MDLRRAAIPVSIAAGGFLAAVVFGLRLHDGLPWWMLLPGAIALGGVVALPPLLAFAASRDRPCLYAAAAVTSITLAFGLSLLGPAMVLLGVVWLWTLLGHRPRRPLRTIAAALVAWTLGVASFLALFVHLDPRCVEYYADGTMAMVPTDMTTGWVWEAPQTETSTMGGSPQVVEAFCSSDVVTWVEAGVSSALVAAAFGGAWLIAGGGRRSARRAALEDASA
ncbi:MAG TPA: hypothetical protein ENK55_03375 [Actinobacteria bacterium]|nr:hypothetical protein [Actinomycetota bacterium]